LLHHRANPCVFYISQHQRAQRAIVIRRPEPTVYFPTGIHESPTLAEIDDLI
jgi:hypothetical protein